MVSRPEPWALLIQVDIYVCFRLKPLAYMYSLIHSSPSTEDRLIEKHLPSILQCFFFKLVATSGDFFFSRLLSNWDPIHFQDIQEYTLGIYVTLKMGVYLVDFDGVGGSAPGVRWNLRWKNHEILAST